MNFIFTDDFAGFLIQLVNKNISAESSELNLLYIITTSIFSGMLIILFLNLWQRKVNYKYYDPEEYPERTKNLKGFFLLIIPIIFFDFIKNANDLYSYVFLFSGKTHHFLTEINPSFLRNWWNILIYFIIFSCVFKVIFSLANLFFLWGRKRLFKFLMLVYIPACVLINGLKYFLVTQVIEPNHFIIYKVFNQWSESLFLSLIIFLYIFFSNRVNAAFSK
jgi:hypothetical protein